MVHDKLCGMISNKNGEHEVKRSLKHVYSQEGGPVTPRIILASCSPIISQVSLKG